MPWKTIFDESHERPWPVPLRRWSVHMRWHEVLFLHWPVAPDLVRRFVARGLELDLHEGVAWIGVVPFRMSDVGLRSMPRIPTASAFVELNVRTYVSNGGKPGVWFFSLDAASAVAVAVARATYRLPYYLAAMQIRPAGASIQYKSRRIDARGASAEFEGIYRPVGPPSFTVPGSLEHFLTARYCLYTCDRRGRLYRGEVHHKPWPLQRARATIERNTYALASGIEVPEIPPLAHYAEALDVVAWPLERVERNRPIERSKASPETSRGS